MPPSHALSCRASSIRRCAASAPAAQARDPRDGRPVAIGALRVQADLARTLGRRAGEGPDVCYKGEIGDAIAADCAANGGFITEGDLESYAVNVTEPIRGTYRG